MKNKALQLLGLIIVLLSIFGFSQKKELKFYYAYNKKIYLKEKEDKLLIKIRNIQDKKKLLDLPNIMSIDKWINDTICIVKVDKNKKLSIQEELRNSINIKSCTSSYYIDSGLEMAATDEFIVKFKDNTSKDAINNLNEKYSVVQVYENKSFQVLRINYKDTDVIEIANKYQESGLVIFSHPNFFRQLELHQTIPNDPYFINQFSLNNTGQIFVDNHHGTADADIDAPEAWDITKGSSDIVIAVIDQGVTSEHPDLPNSRQIRLNGSNFGDGDSNNPSPTGNQNHGNACAGIIAATQNNNQGISGVAPNCKIMPIRIAYSSGSFVSDIIIAEAIKFAYENGADIISNSWGYNSSDQNLIPVIKQEIINATTLGRDNKGAIVVFSAGNNFSNDGFVHFPSNVDVEGVLTVGASDRYDKKAYYSPLANPSSSNNQLIDLVAPSHRAYSNQISGETFEAWSIDIPNNDGYNPVKSTDGGYLPSIGEISPNSGVNNLSYTSRFGGTSYSCPQVSGTAALILSINPELSQIEVYSLLTNSPDKVGAYTYTNGRSNELGFGRLNAKNAVDLALSSLNILGSSVVCSSNSAYSLNNLPTGTSIEWSNSSNIQRMSDVDVEEYVVKSNGVGSGWIKVNINGTIINKNVDVGVNGSFTGPYSINYLDYGTWFANANCGTEPYYYQWYLDKIGDNDAAAQIGTGQQLSLKSVAAGTSQQQLITTETIESPTIMGPSNYTTFNLSLKISDDNGYYRWVGERTITAYGDVDLIQSYDPGNPTPFNMTATTEQIDYVTIYPNPADDELIISSLSDLTVDLILYDEQSNIIFKGKLNRHFQK